MDNTLDPATHGQHPLRALRHRRIGAGLSLRGAARLAGCTAGHWSRVERGERRVSVAMAMAMAEAVRLDPAETAALLGVAVEDVGRSWQA